MKELMIDYLSMEQMLIGNFPSLDKVIHYLQELAEIKPNPSKGISILSIDYFPTIT